jgi:meso-butanediol dehydrogenase/(S,S)-butanediol dehydrogenase/diacetyl reductase
VRPRESVGNGRLAGQRVVVTGAGRGIGRAIAHAFASEGAQVALFARTKTQLEEVEQEIERLGSSAIVVRGDVTSDKDVDDLRDRVSSAWGGLDVLVNNAGIYQADVFLGYTMSDWERSLNVNVLGTVRVTRAFLPAMLRAKKGRIINIASTAGKWGSLYQSTYNVAKHGILGLTRCLALETASVGVRVNAICPGWVETDFVDHAKFASLHGLSIEDVPGMMSSRAPIGRMVKPEEVAALAVYLASPEADAITGIGVTLAGGMVLI